MPRVNDSKKTKTKEGNRLKKLRLSMGMNMRDFSKEFKVSLGSISQWETGEHTMPGPVLRLIELYEEKLQNK